MEGNWLSYGGGQFNGENGHVTEVVTLMKGEWSVTEIASLMEGEWSLRGWPVERRENGHVTEVASLKETEWSCYRGGLMEGVVTEVARLRENGHVTEVITLKKG